MSETIDCVACHRKHTRAAGCNQAVLDAIDRTMATDRDPPPIEQGRSFHDRLVDAELLRGLCDDEDDEPATVPYRHGTPERPPGRGRARGKVEPDCPSVGALSKSCRLRAFMTFGTRPEAIKMAPIIDECRRRSEQIETVVCLTGQHRELLAQVTRYFGIQADANLALMRPGQSPAEVTARCLDGLDRELARLRPDCVVVQGDTSTVMAGAVAAFLHRIPLVHLEAGLRTGNMLAPWPEEMNRRVASLAATLHCAPTERAAANLKAEGIPGCKIHVTGNTVIDALLATRERERANAAHWQQQYAMLGDRRLVLVTGHRRESFCGGHERVCRAVAILACRFSDSVFLYPVHLNPTVQAAVRPRLSGLANVHLVEPASYPAFVWLMDRAHLILTDSGGVQEEAPSLGKPVLVTRETTERPEAVEAGAAELVGTDVERIVSRATLLLTDREAYEARRIDSNPYGDGQAARRIVDLMLRQGWGMDDGRNAATSVSQLAKMKWKATQNRTVNRAETAKRKIFWIFWDPR